MAENFPRFEVSNDFSMQYTISLYENGTKYVQFVENPTKTRQAGLKAKPRSFLPKMFSTGEKN